MITISHNSVVSPKGDITLYSISNSAGTSVVLSSLGAGIVAVNVPDKDGKIADVALGYKNILDYFYDGPCAGKTPGRYANRIAKGHFPLDGKIYNLAINNGPNALHGGPEGFQNRIWKSEEVENGVKFTRISAYGEEGYPGEVSISVTYTWDEENILSINYLATTNRNTIINLTNHAYFNLKGEGCGDILNHKLQLFSHKWLPTDDTQIPTGELADVANTPMDFTSPKAIGANINDDFEALKIGKGYDHCWAVDDWQPGKLCKVAHLFEETSGRVLDIESTQPGVQIYTGNWLKGCPESKSGAQYNDYEGVALECQGFPDAPNKPSFPSQILKVGEEYKHTIIFKFSTIK